MNGRFLHEAFVLRHLSLHQVKHGEVACQEVVGCIANAILGKDLGVSNEIEIVGRADLRLGLSGATRVVFGQAVDQVQVVSRLHFQLPQDCIGVRGVSNILKVDVGRVR